MYIHTDPIYVHVKVMFYKRVLRQALRKLAKDNVGITFLKIPFFFSKEKKNSFSLTRGKDLHPLYVFNVHSLIGHTPNARS